MNSDDLDISDLAELSLEELLEVVVTSSGGEEEERGLASGNVLVIDRDDIARRGLRSLAEVLTSVSGLYLIDDLLVPSLSVRGVNGGLRAGTRLVKVLINRVPVTFRPDLTALLGPEFIPIEAVERVEIVQGPLSALYGANAFIATINVITRQPESASTTELALGGNVVQGHLGGGLSAFAAKGGESLGVVAAISESWINRSGLAGSAARTAVPQGFNFWVIPAYSNQKQAAMAFFAS